ncbi:MULTISPECIES: TrkH family potassium uptake protein [Sphingobacterium]|uniref:TrkH family potassium uptake protein n=1 Tax=Sphingobacterium TaxID=28453 RepID=UPI0019D0B6C6|nr:MULTISPECIES: potassium transporter TrkG [Sphingobacterium]
MESIASFLKFVFRYRKGIVDKIMFYVSMICALTVIVHVGYITNPDVAIYTKKSIFCMFYGLFLLELIRTGSSIYASRRINVSQYSGVVVVACLTFIMLARLSGWSFLAYFAREEWMYFGIGVIFLSELSKSSLFFDNFYFNPTILFVISFIGLILIGTLLLMLPRTTLHAPLSFMDALFMATSAVCITGLTVSDISTNFSLFGQSVIMVLIQVGGLGIMTFTGFFGYFFSGGFSFKNQLMFGEILGENKLNSVISTLLTIISITLLFEFIGAAFIFFSLDSAHFDNVGQQVFFSVFHSISSFCNSGFTILQDGIGNINYRFNYGFQIVLALIFVLGGMGFGTVYNFYTYVKSQLKALFSAIVEKRPFKHKAQQFSFNTKFIVLCNMIVLFLATVSYYLMEQKFTLSEDKSAVGEWVTSFFMANASRSAGFNSVNISFVNIPTLIMITTLMWIGVAPGSTGGGVKVTTIALAFMNIIALARGKDSIEIFRRKIASESINKAFAIIILSVLTITFSFILLNVTDPDKEMIPLLFESVSAYTTCGLSMGVTQSLSAAGKFIIIVTMFVGRVGMLTLLVAFIKNTKNKSYIYPTEKLMF